jgi:hypothetical protein
LIWRLAEQKPSSVRGFRTLNKHLLFYDLISLVSCRLLVYEIIMLNLIKSFARQARLGFRLSYVEFPIFRLPQRHCILIQTIKFIIFSRIRSLIDGEIFGAYLDTSPRPSMSSLGLLTLSRLYHKFEIFLVIFLDFHLFVKALKQNLI